MDFLKWYTWDPLHNFLNPLWTKNMKTKSKKIKNSEIAVRFFQNTENPIGGLFVEQCTWKYFFLHDFSCWFQIWKENWNKFSTFLYFAKTSIFGCHFPVNYHKYMANNNILWHKIKFCETFVLTLFFLWPR